MEAHVKKALLAQLAFPVIQYGVLVLIAYINVYWFEKYDPKFSKAGAFEFYRSLIGYFTAITSVLYSITFLVSVRSIWNQVQTFSWFTFSLPIAVCSLIQVGLLFPFVKFGVGVVLWLFLIPPVLAWFSVKFISEQQLEFDTE